MPMVGEQAASHPAQSGKDTEKYKTTKQTEQNELASVKYCVM